MTRPVPIQAARQASKTACALDVGNLIAVYNPTSAIAASSLSSIGRHVFPKLVLKRIGFFLPPAIAMALGSFYKAPCFNRAQLRLAIVTLRAWVIRDEGVIGSGSNF